MTTTKSVIANNISTSMSSIYTNNSGGNAVLKSINIDGLADAGLFNPTTTSTLGADEWNYFGSAVMPLIQEGTPTSAWGFPNVVKLSADRLLLIWLPHYTHMAAQLDFLGGNTIHTQVVEYQSSFDRYVAGPIVNVQLPTTPFNSTSNTLRSFPTNLSGGGNPNLRGIALTPTKVVLAYRNSFNTNDFRLMRLNIVGNAVDLSTVTNLDITTAAFFNTTTSSAFDLSIVPGDTNKVLVGGGAPTNWSVQGYNVPDTGAISNNTLLVSTGIAVDTARPFALTNAVKEPTGNSAIYVVAAGTSATGGSVLLMSYDSSTNALATVGTANNIAAVTAWTGLEAQCVSTGTNVNVIIAGVDSGATSTFRYWRQTSNTAAGVAAATLTLQSSVSSRSMGMSFNWGDERAIFSGDTMHVVVDSSGTATNLVPTTLSTSTARIHGLMFPFDSRPLYNVYDPASVRADAATQLFSRTGMTSSTSVGNVEFFRNYLPWGHDYGGNYRWHPQANCWIVAYHGKLFALSKDGVVLDEISLFNLDPAILTFAYTCKLLDVTPSGKIILFADFRQGSESAIVNSNLATTWDGLNNNGYFLATLPIFSPYQLNKASLISSVQDGAMATSITAFQDYTGTDRAFVTYVRAVSSPTVNIWTFADNNWSSGGTIATSVSTTTAGLWNTGRRPHLKLIQDTPCSQSYPMGLWRLVGGRQISTQAAYGQLGHSTALAPASFASLNPASVTIASTTPTGYSMTHQQSENISVLAYFDNTSTVNNVRVWPTVRGRLTYPRGWLNTANNIGLNYVTSSVSKFNYLVALNSTTANVSNGVAYVFNEANVNAPIVTVATPAVANGHGVWVNKTTDKLAVSLFSNNAVLNTRATYSTIGTPDFNRVFIGISDANNVTFVVGAQALSSNGFFRSTDTYLVPNGFSVMARSESPNTYSALVTVVEER